MEEELFDAIHEHADKHWWFRGRKRILFSLLDRHHLNREGAVLDLGCGVGNHLQALSRYGTVHGADPSQRALAFCRQRFEGPLSEVWLPDTFPYADETFDLVVMFDVLEHIRDDAESLQRIIRSLKPGGTLALTVPALMWLWSYHDEEHHHFRRYHRRPLRHLLEASGFEVVKISHMNAILLPLMGAVRLLLRPRTWSARDLAGGTRFPARLLEHVFAFERHLLRWFNLPLGGSLVAVCRRPKDLKLAPWLKKAGVSGQRRAVVDEGSSEKRPT